MPMDPTIWKHFASAPPAASEPPTIAHACLRTVAREPDTVALRTTDGALTLTWAQAGDRVARLAAGLRRLGVGPGDTVALLLKNRPEFLLADVAAMMLGAVPYSLYATLPAVQIVPQLDNADTRIAITERAFLPQLLQARALHPALRTIVVLEGDGGADTLPWSAVERDDDAIDLGAAAATVQPDDLATIVYTSGTTGPAKGVELTHRGLVAAVRTNRYLLGRPPDRRFLSWLPTAGMAERITSHYLPLVDGGTVVYCDDPRRAAEALTRAHPHVFFGPPRFWEKLRAGVESRWADLPAADRPELERALQRAVARVRADQCGEPVDAADAAHRTADDRRWFAPMRAALGLDADEPYFVTGGANAPHPMLEWFSAVGLPLHDCYGLTESCSFGTRHPPGRPKLGTVGIAQPGIEVRLADDGEVLIRAPALMRGYRKRPDATAEALDAEGWLHTGDVGTMDSGGWLRIVDRKKDLIAGSGGRKMSPANIEAAIVEAGTLIAQAVAIGNDQPYNVALLTIDSVALAQWAAAQAPALALDVQSLLRHPALRDAVDAQVRRGNAGLARVEQIKRFAIVGTEWPPGSEEVTPTMKLRRKAIDTRHAATIAALYAVGDGKERNIA